MAFSKREVVTEKETILVERSGQWGPQVNGEYYSVNAPLTPDMFKQGQSYDVLIKRGKPSEKYPTGKKYIAQLVRQAESQTKNSGPTVQATAGGVLSHVPVSAPTTSYAAKADSTDKEKYWEDKNKSMLVGGLFHDAATLTAAIVSTNGLTEEQALESFKRVLDRIVAIRG